MLIVEEVFAPALWLRYAIWLALLQPTKGAVVALQWQLGMHGFDRAKQQREFVCSRSVT
jgi:uncharacterized protein (DUF983 family)